MQGKLLLSMGLGLVFWLGGAGNDPFSGGPEKTIKAPNITIAGEIEQPYEVDLSTLPRHTMVTREMTLAGGKPKFVGAYQYTGYSLFDILNQAKVVKKNRARFKPKVDLFVTLENAKGEQVLCSWGEIYLAAIPHRIIIATGVAPIVPTRTKEKWPLPTLPRLVCGNDQLTLRNLTSPCRIKVHSSPVNFKVNRTLKPLHAPKITIANGTGPGVELTELPGGGEERVYPSTFYGYGRGFHGYHEFKGKLLRQVIGRHFIPTNENMLLGYIVAAGIDGYRAVFSVGEIFNRNDQQEFLLVDRGKGQERGRYFLYPAADFFSDRAIYALSDLVFQRFK